MKLVGLNKTEQTQTPAGSAESVASKPSQGKPAKLPFLKIILCVVVLAALGGGGYAGYRLYKQAAVPATTKAANEINLANKALLTNNKSQALADTKKALSYEPDNLQNTLLAASLSMSENPSQAKTYYAQALNEFKKQSSPDVAGKRPIVYFDAGYMAQQAGEIAQAKQYYQEAITSAANSSDSYDTGVAQQAQAALEGLQ